MVSPQSDNLCANGRRRLIINSRSNSKVKYVRKLQQDKRFRHKERRFVVEGTRWMGETVRQQGQIDLWFATEGWLRDQPELTAELTALGHEPLIVTELLLKEMSDTATPPGVLAVLHTPTWEIPVSPSLILILDQMRDPGNLGTLIRAASASSVDLIMLMPGSVDPTNPKVVRSTMGALLHLPLVSTTWEALPQQIGECRLYVADFDLTSGIPYSEVNWRVPSGLIVGGEANGPSARGKALADQITYIPMHTRVESLNAGIAGSVILFEADRQRRLSADF